jgi:hypothetical protein
MSERDSAVSPAAHFTERFARVRHRFVSSLESKIDSVYAALPKLSGEGTAVAEIVDENYRRIHDIVGVSPSVGFFATGRVARTVENILIPARCARRGLKSDEINSLKNALHALRETSHQELQSTFSDRR